MSYSSRRAQNNDFAVLKEKFNILNGKTSFNNLDETYWTPAHVAGPDGNGEAIIRFHPAPPDGKGGQEPDDIVKYTQYSKTRNGKTYVNKSRHSLGADEPDPANDYNKSIWARKDLSKEEKKKLLANRKINYVANITVVKDPNRPENEGKEFRFEFGPQIFDKIQLSLFPEFESDPSVNVFDPIEGADFVLRIVSKTIPDQVTGQPKKVPSYDQSKFLAPSARWTLEEYDAVWERLLPLQTEIAPEKFKSYDELKKHWDRVMGDAESPTDAWNKQDDKPASYNKPAPAKNAEQTKQLLNDDLPPWEESGDDDSGDDGLGDLTKLGSDSTMGSSDVDDWFSQIGK